MSAWIRKWIPPNLHELLAECLEEGFEWYELRTGTGCISFAVDEYETAVINAQSMKRIFRKSTEGLFYCWVQGGKINELNVC